MAKAKRAVAIVLVLLLMLMCTACQSGITGKWRSTSEKHTQLAFSSSGKVTMSADGITMAGSYTAEGDRLVMTLNAPDGEVYIIEAVYTIDGKKLYLENKKGQVEVFER
ncbi:MAG: hypothetical protein E7559_06555 [Ruminococcaceae bacterium]|nr:hypothetical protein [Oscillospiraceae bacterium]